MLYLALALLAPFVAFLVGVFFYVAGSYLFAWRHHPPVSFATVPREAMREFVWTLVIVPLLPLFYFLGHRMARRRKAGDAAPRRPVIFVHGYMQNRVGFVILARALAKRGFADLFGFNYAWWAPIGSSAKHLSRFVEKVCEECGAERVDLVCHSMGGLVALEYLRSPEGTGRVERCASIASPYRGVRWRGPIPGRAAPALRKGLLLGDGEALSATTKLLSVYSTHDNIVHPSATSSLAPFGGTDLEVGAMGHFTILFDRRAITAVADFLGEQAA